MTHLILTKWGYRDAATGRWARPQQLWRFNYGLTFVKQGDYFGAIIQAWSVARNVLEGESARLVSILQDAVADFLGYRDWLDWSFVKADGQGFQQVPYDKGLEGSWEWWVEDDKGRSLKHDRGEL